MKRLFYLVHKCSYITVGGHICFLNKLHDMHSILVKLDFFNEFCGPKLQISTETLIYAWSQLKYNWATGK